MRVLFLGNSHVAAYRYACDSDCNQFMTRMDFFCARGADLFFAELKDNQIVSASDRRMTSAQLCSFYGRDPVPWVYKGTNHPMEDVGAQFARTGHSPAADLEDVEAIFYASGMSPYDFARAGPASLTRNLCEYLDSLLGRDFFLRALIEDIRRDHPDCRHYMIGRPIAVASHFDDLDQFDCDRVAELRDRISSLADCYLFDGVYQPSDRVLEPSLLATRHAFSIGGARDAVAFQGGGGDPTDDTTHMNGDYGRIVMEDFVLPSIENTLPDECGLGRTEALQAGCDSLAM